MNKKLILFLAVNIFGAQINAQSFFEKYNKQIYASTVSIGLLVIFKLINSNNKLYKENRAQWIKKHAAKDVGIQTDAPVEISIKLEVISNPQEDVSVSGLSGQELEDIYS